MAISYINMLPPLPTRPEQGNKGTFGKVLIVAGSRGMSGAACLSGLGALRGGAGLVTLAVPASLLAIVAAVEPSYLTVPLTEDSSGRIGANAAREILDLASSNTVVACGPGWGRSSDLQNLALTLYRQLPLPLVVDADGLNVLSKIPGGLPTQQIPGPRVLTPHPGEFARLTGFDVPTIENDRESLAVEFAARHNVVLLLKGHKSVITDGTRVTLNTTGNSGMATGGSGDVLTGLIAALLAQGMAPFEAAQLGAHLHGLAGDLAATELTRPAMIASDVVRFLPAAWKQLGSN